MMGFDQIPVAFHFFLAAIVVPFIPAGRLRGMLTLAVPILAAYNIGKWVLGTLRLRLSWALTWNSCESIASAVFSP
jgi:hypothetical protein